MVGSIMEGFKDDAIFTRCFGAVTLIQKMLFMLCLVGSYDYPIMQVVGV